MTFRRRLLVLGGAILLAVTLITFGNRSAVAQGGLGDGSAPELEGTWITTVSLYNFSIGVQDPPPIEGVLHTFTRGGATLIGLPAPGLTMQGVWTKVGPHRYAFTVEGELLDPFGVQERTKVKEVIEVHGDEYFSVQSSAVDTYADGRKIEYCARTHGRRMKVESPDSRCAVQR